MGKFVSFNGLARFKGWLDVAFGQVDDALGTKADKTPVVSQSASVAIEPNKVTKLGALTGSVTLTLAVGETGKANIYDVIFSTGSSTPTITWPSGISWAGGSAPTINASKNYEVSISEGLAMITEF